MPKIDVELLQGSQGFYRNLLAGHFHKDLIRVILEQSGYEVYPYGYESFLTPLKIKFERDEIKKTEVSKKIRSTPDLLVYDPESCVVQLCEVKSRDWDHTDTVRLNLQNYQRYWKGSVVAALLPAGHFFYAQFVDKFRNNAKDSYNLEDDFEWFEDVFRRADLETLYSYKTEVINFWNRERERYKPFSDKTPERFNLYSLIREIGKCNRNTLFHKQNRRNLITRKAFNQALKVLAEEGKITEERQTIQLVGQ